MPSLRARLGALLAVPRQRDARVYAVASVIDALGNAMFLPVSALFFVNVAGLPTTQVGLGLSIAGFAGLAGPLLGGPWVDRAGARRPVLLLHLVRAGLYACYPLVRGFWPFVALVAVTSVVDHMARPALQAMVAGLTDEADRITTLAFVRSVRNIGWGVGGLVVAGALAVGGRGAYVALVLANAATFVVAAALLARVRDVRVPPSGAPPVGYRAVLRDRRFVVLAALHGLLTLHLSVLLIGFPLWIDQRTAAPAWVAGAVFALNSFMVVFLQVPFSRRATTVAGGGRALRNSGLALFAACALLALTPGLPVWPAVGLLLVIGVVECVGEISEGVGGWGVSLGLAPAHARGRYLGLWELGFAAHYIGGPVLMAFIVEDAGPAGWLVLGAALAVVGAVAQRVAARAPVPATA
ncbi:MAG TPA: MFS transporter [Frankiaceae bacterium]|nr:MFS transporter [Frankiaceae bacterium]